jgi:radical SAM superfamily enzyme YgiQ (UPF0313 family)
MKLEIALIFAQADVRRGTRIKHFMVPPYGLQIISAETPSEHHVTLIDEYHRPADPDLQADLIGISVWTASATRAYDLADRYRGRGIPVILGGPHVTVCPEEAQSHADAIVIGEAESVWRGLLHDFERRQLQPRYIGQTLPLACFPIPDWTPIKANHYIIQSSLITSRGCTRRCDFCYESCRPKPNYRQRALESVLTEIDMRPSPVIAFMDNDLMADRRYAKELLKALIPRKIYWLGMTSISTADDEECLDLVAESGCRTLFVGFESIIPDNLKDVHKGCNRVENYQRNIRRIHDRGIMINGSFVFGFDNDDGSVFDRTVNFGIEACLETATFTILTPYPGTILHQRLSDAGRIVDRDWSHYDTTHAVFSPRKMSKETLESGYFSAYEKFYSWPSIVRRCRRCEPGFAKRLFLNAAYKRVEPIYRLFGHPFRAGWFRFLFNWYARPFGAAPGIGFSSHDAYGGANGSESQCFER